MKTIDVTDRAAGLIRALRIDENLSICKSGICDLMCAIIDKADEYGTIADDMPFLCELSSIAELYTELGKTPE